MKMLSSFKTKRIKCFGSLNQIGIIFCMVSLISSDHLRVKICGLLDGLIWLFVKPPVFELFNEEQETSEILMAR